MNKIFLTIIVGIITSILVKYLLYYIQKFWYYWPKIKIEFEAGTTKAHSNDMVHRTFMWSGNMILYNITKHDALNIVLEWPTGKPPFQLDKLNDKHLKGLTTQKLKYNVGCRFLISDIANADVETFYPIECKEFKIVLCYENEMGKSFYTLFKKDVTGEFCTFHKKKPKVN